MSESEINWIDSVIRQSGFVMRSKSFSVGNYWPENAVNWAQNESQGQFRSRRTIKMFGCVTWRFSLPLNLNRPLRSDENNNIRSNVFALWIEKNSKMLLFWRSTPAFERNDGIIAKVRAFIFSSIENTSVPLMLCNCLPSIAFAFAAHLRAVIGLEFYKTFFCSSLVRSELHVISCDQLARRK